MEAINRAHEDKGGNHPTQGVLDQAKYSRQQFARFLADLIASGLGETFLSALEKAISDVEAAVGKQKVTRDDSSALSRDEEKALEAGNSLKRKLWTSLSLVLEPNDESKLALEQFAAGRVNNSSSKLSLYFDRIKPQVEALDERLKPYFNGGLASARLAEVKAALDDVQSRQELSAASAPIETRRLNEAKGRLIELIERGNAVARIAFDDKPEIRELFNKDLLKRSHRRSRKAEDGGESADSADSAASSDSVPE